MITLLVDGNALAYTIKISDCIDSKDFAKKYLDKLRDYAKIFTSMVKICIFFDNKLGGTWRDKLYPDYQKDRKAQYDKYTDEQKDEVEKRNKYIKYLKESIDKSKFNYISYPNTESDDLISLYCNNIQEDGETVIILTTDKDLFQLISNNYKKKVYVLFLIKKQLIKDEKEGKEILEKKIMLGDPSDSIPSVCKGVGPKYYPYFKVFLTKMKENGVDYLDKDKQKEISESLGIKYINSFSNFNPEQLRINKLLVDLRTVCVNDEKDDYIKTKYLKSIINSARFSPFSLYNIKLE